METEFHLVWFSTENDELVGSELLNITEEQVREWFWMQDDDPVLDGQIVRASQRQQLQQLVQHQIDLNKYDYILEHTRKV